MLEIEVGSAIERLELRPVSGQPLRFGFVESAPWKRKLSALRCWCVVEGAVRNQQLQLALLVHPFDPTCSSAPARFASAAFWTDAEGHLPAG